MYARARVLEIREASTHYYADTDSMLITYHDEPHQVRSETEMEIRADDEFALFGKLLKMNKDKHFDTRLSYVFKNIKTRNRYELWMSETM